MNTGDSNRKGSMGRTIYPNLEICQKCPRFDFYRSTGLVMCKDAVTSELKTMGTIKLDENQEKPMIITYSPEFCLPHDCNFELEQLWFPPTLMNQQ